MSRENTTLIEKIVFALVEANLFPICSSQKNIAKNETIFVLKQFRSLPLFYFYPLFIFLLGFNFILSLSFKPFHKQTVLQRENLLKKYRRYSLPFLKDFLKFFDTLSIFAYYFYLDQSNLTK